MKTQATTLYPFVPAGMRFERSLDFFAALGFEKQWQKEGLAGLRFGGAYFILQDINVPEWQKNQMITFEVTDLDAYSGELGEPCQSVPRGEASAANQLPLGPGNAHHRSRGRVLARSPGDLSGLVHRGTQFLTRARALVP